MARIGIDLGGTKIEGIVLERGGDIAVRRRVPTPAGYAAKIDAIARITAELEAVYGRTGLSVGIGHPGSLNPRTGLPANTVLPATEARLRREVLEAVASATGGSAGCALC